MNHKVYTLLIVAAATVGTLHSQAAEEPGFTTIFNGNDLAGWTGNPKLWSVKDGVITGQTTPENPAKGNTFLIWTNGTVSDFELRFSYKAVPNNTKNFANSGVQYRSKVFDADNWVVGGYQADLEAGPTYTGILYEEKMSRGIMAARGEKVVWNKECKKEVTGSLGSGEELGKAIKSGDWNDYVVIAKGNHLQHFINGKQMVDVTDDCESKRAMNGVLALQLHAGDPMTVQFRNLRLQNLSNKSAAATDDDIQKLQGKWQATKGKANAEPLPDEMINGITLTVKGTNYTSVIGDQNDNGTLTIDSSKEPKQVDVQSETGDHPHLVGIYEANADTLRFCFAMQGGDRPKVFATGDEPGMFFIEYKRKQE
jgi:uncharacterized protein (TIGR03067 family)